MKVLITFALANEFAPWRQLRTFRPGKWGEADAYFAEIGGAEVGVVLTGAGPRRACIEMSRIVWDESDSLGVCVSSGLAGALQPEYQIGQILAARSVFSEIPRVDLGSPLLQSSDPLLSFASESGARIVDRFYSADRVVGRVEEKRHLGQTADAVEMESFEILKAAAGFGIPAVAIRAISDVADEELPLDMNLIFNDEGEVSVPSVAAQVARHPQALPGLIKLGQQSKRAAEKLAHFLDRYVAVVVERAKTLELKATVAAR